MGRKSRDFGEREMNEPQMSVREVDVSRITDEVARACIEANMTVGEGVRKAVEAGLAAEKSAVGREVLETILQNLDIAAEDQVPACQDTGMAVVFVEVGQDVHLVGGSLEDAVNAGIRKGYLEGYLRKSVVSDPLRRANTGDNTPGIIHVRLVPGDKVKITVAPKGGGAENMSRLAMLTPADGREGIVEFILDTVRRAGPNACPPLVIGVGIGGNFEKAAVLSKEALMRPVGRPNSDPYYAGMEREILSKVNRLGIGPQGFGGVVTALGVAIEAYPCHFASLPVAVNLNCHVTRHKTVEI